MASGYSVAEQKINLSVLQQKDPYITGIADSASQVAAYSFNSALNEWEKTNIEGTLFVYTRSAFPLNGFMIINRLHLNDLIEPINKNLEFQLQDPFLLYRNSQACIYGIWFYDQDECARIGQLMNSLVQVASDTQAPEMGRQRRASESDSSKERPVTSSEHNNVKVAAISPQRNNVDIMQMLSKAQDEYDKGINTSSPARRKTGTSPVTLLDKQANSVSFDAGLTFSHTVSGSGDIQHSNSTHINLETLFRRASQHHETAVPDQRFTDRGIKSAFHMPPLLPPNQTTPTVEEIERAQRESNAGHLSMRGTTSSSASDTKSGIIVTAPTAISSNTAAVGSYYVFQQQNNSRGKQPAPESPNTALRRTLNIVPPASSTGVCPSPASSTNRQRDLSQNFSTSAKPGNTVVQALFSQNQHLQQAAHLCSSVHMSTTTSITSSAGVPSAFVSFAHPLNAQQVPNHSIVSDWLSKMGQSSNKPPQACVGGMSPASSDQNIKQLAPKASSKGGQPLQSTPSDMPLKCLPLSEILSRTFTDQLAKPETFLTNLTKNEVFTACTATGGTTLLTPMAFQAVGSSLNMPKTLMNLNGSEISPSLAETTFMSAPAALFNSSGGATRNHLTSNRSSSNELGVQNDLEDLQIAPLNKEQLKQALITLLKTDASFLSAIHEAYTTSLNRELSNHKM